MAQGSKGGCNPIFKEKMHFWPKIELERGGGGEKTTCGPVFRILRGGEVTLACRQALVKALFMLHNLKHIIHGDTSHLQHFSS